MSTCIIERFLHQTINDGLSLRVGVACRVGVASQCSDVIIEKELVSDVLEVSSGTVRRGGVGRGGVGRERLYLCASVIFRAR